jgi:arginine decarboxylase
MRYDTIRLQQHHPRHGQLEELDIFHDYLGDRNFNIGVRVATEEEPHFEFYTSRLGIRKSEILDFYKEKVQNKSMQTSRCCTFSWIQASKTMSIIGMNYAKELKHTANLKKYVLH